MSYLEYDLGLSDEQREIREAARKFAAEVLRPAGLELDRLSAEAVVAPDSPLFEVIRKASQLGYTRCGGPSELGGLGLAPTTQHLVLEELAWGNAGLCGVIFLAATHATFALATGDPQLIEEFAKPYFACEDGSILGCWAVTEPDHGSDMLSVVRPEMRVPTSGQLSARRDGEDWILNGQKSAWISNGPIASHALLHVQIEPEGVLHRGGVCLLPLDLPGVSRGRPLDKHGARSLPQTGLFFDGVRIPERWMIASGKSYAPHVEHVLTAFNASVSAAAVGLARAAFECALAYTKVRVQGDRPIFEHQSVRARLFRMFSLVQASRSLSRQVYVHNATRLQAAEPAPLHHSIAAKVFCSQAAHEVATLAVQLHGGFGVTREYPVEMLLRDATAFTIADGENAFLAQLGASAL
jgi:alkylation response protein AidB-like acyl-CoA dehydrogenase